MKTILSWIVAMVAVSGVSAGSAYLAFDASPDPIVVTDEVVVEVQEKYSDIAYLAVYEDGIVEFESGGESGLAPGWLYIIYCDWDLSESDAEGGYTVCVIVLDLPNRSQVRITVPSDNYKVRVVMNPGIAEGETGPESEDEF